MDINSIFSMAEALQRDSMYAQAVRCYSDAVSIGGSSEKVYWSQFMIGVILEGTGAPSEKVVEAYLKCSEFDNLRAEHLLHLIIMYQKKGMYETAYNFSLAAMRFNKKNPRPYRSLYVDDLTYSHKIFDCHKLNCSVLGKPELSELIKLQDEESLREKSRRFTETYKETVERENKIIDSPKAVAKFSNSVRYNTSFDKRYFTKKRILSLGDLGKVSEGGIYNPSILKFGDYGNFYHGLVRVESDYKAYEGFKFISPSYPVYYRFSSGFNEEYHLFLNQEGYDVATRIEDFRCFNYKDKILVAHSGIEIETDNIEFRQYLSELDLKNKSLKKIKKFPAFHNRSEKNWGWFVMNDELYVLYSVSPFTVYKYSLEDDSLSLVHTADFKGKWNVSGYLALSTLPIEYEGNYMAFVHSRIPEYTYAQGILIFDKNFKPLYFAKNPILVGGSEEGKNKGVIYVSSVIVEKDELHIFFGEADSHSSALTISRKDFNEIIYKNPI